MALVPDQKFSTFDDGGDIELGDIVVGLRGGINTRFNYTGDLPVGFVVPVSQGGTGANNVTDARTNLGLGTMAVQNANAVAITAGSAALTTGSVAGAPSVGIDIANKTYVDSMVGGSVASVSGTANRVTSTGGTNPVIDISAAYVGQTSITTLGTIGTGTWHGTVVGGTYGGTGVNNGSFTITLGGSLVTSGAFSSTFTMTGVTTVTFPTSGTLATTAQLPTPSALTKVDDTNVTVTLGGTPATALLQATSLTMGWTGTLSVNRGGLGFGTTPNDGELPIGDGSGYTLATLTEGTGITIVNAPGSITISSSGGGGGITWTEVTGTSDIMTENTGWITNNAGLVTLTLPTTAAIGTALSIVGKGAGGWIIGQLTGQNIQVGNVSTTVGFPGSISSSNRFDSVNLICTTADTTWTVSGGPQSAGLNIF